MNLISIGSDGTFKVALEDEERDATGAETLTQYGMRYPDGTILWDTDPDFAGFFVQIVRGNPDTLRRWHSTLESRARRANVDREEYIAAHRPVKRTITVVIGKVEE